MQSSSSAVRTGQRAADGDAAGLVAQGPDRARSRPAHPVRALSAARGAADRSRALHRTIGASRTALRDALLTLAAKGLIEARKRAGTRVRPPSDWNRLDAHVLGWMGEIEPDLDFVRGLIEARLVIEPAAANSPRRWRPRAISP